MQSVNSAQFLNITPLFLSSDRSAASFAPAPVIFIVPLTSMYASLSAHKLDLDNEVLNYVMRSTCHSSGDIYLPLCISLGISLSFPFVTVSKLFFCEFFETLILF